MLCDMHKTTGVHTSALDANSLETISSWQKALRQWNSLQRSSQLLGIGVLKNDSATRPKKQAMWTGVCSQVSLPSRKKERENGLTTKSKGRKPVHAVWKGWSHVKCLTNSFWGIDIWHRHMWHLSPRISSPWHLGSTWAAAASKVCMQPTLYSAFASANTMISWRLKPKRVEDVAVPSRAARCKGHWPCGKWNQLEASWDPFAFHGKKTQ